LNRNRPLFRSIGRSSAPRWGVGIESDIGSAGPEPNQPQEVIGTDLGPSAELPQESAPAVVGELDAQRAAFAFDANVETPILTEQKLVNTKQMPNPVVVNEMVGSHEPTYSLSFDSKKQMSYIKQTPKEYPEDARQFLIAHKLCSLPPDKGTGSDDVFRYYFNAVVQQCLAFSYSGSGGNYCYLNPKNPSQSIDLGNYKLISRIFKGNANRFTSVKNCYEICHPADPNVNKLRVVSGIKAYLMPENGTGSTSASLSSRSSSNLGELLGNKDVNRQIANPSDPSKVLTIVRD